MKLFLSITAIFIGALLLYTVFLNLENGSSFRGKNAVTFGPSFTFVSAHSSKHSSGAGNNSSQKSSGSDGGGGEGKNATSTSSSSATSSSHHFSPHFINPRFVQQQAGGGGGSVVGSDVSSSLPKKLGIIQSQPIPSSGSVSCGMHFPSAKPECSPTAKLTVNSLEDGSNSVVGGHYIILDGCGSIVGIGSNHKYSFSTDSGNIDNPTNSCSISARSPSNLLYPTPVQYRLNVTESAGNIAHANATILVLPASH